MNTKIEIEIEIEAIISPSKSVLQQSRIDITVQGMGDDLFIFMMISALGALQKPIVMVSAFTSVFS